MSKKGKIPPSSQLRSDQPRAPMIAARFPDDLMKRIEELRTIPGSPKKKSYNLVLTEILRKFFSSKK